MMVDKSLDLSVRSQCNLLGLSRSKLFYKPKSESKFTMHLMRIIDEQYLRTPFYGVPRMTEFIKEQYGYTVNKKRIARLYKLMDIEAIGPKPNTSKSNKKEYKYPYLLKNLPIIAVNQVWAADITFIYMPGGFMYLFAIIDLYSRYIVHWDLSNSMTSQWCIKVIQEAIMMNGKPEIFNTDQGTQFTSEHYVEYLQSERIRISMDGKGRAIDNIFIERFWRTIKYEYVYIKLPNGGLELFHGLDEYIRFYNYERQHNSLKKKTPGEVFYGKKITFKQTSYLTSVV